MIKLFIIIVLIKYQITINNERFKLFLLYQQHTGALPNKYTIKFIHFKYTNYSYTSMLHNYVHTNTLFLLKNQLAMHIQICYEANCAWFRLLGSSTHVEMCGTHSKKTVLGRQLNRENRNRRPCGSVQQKDRPCNQTCKKQ